MRLTPLLWWLAVAVAVLLALSGFHQGYPITHSVAMNLSWTAQFSQQVLAGQWWPRWLEQAFASMGNPTFNFYPPISLYATVPFVALGASISTALIGSMALATVMLAIGAYKYSARVFQAANLPYLPALVASLTVLSPYFLENVYIRGSLGEVWAIVWLAWLLWALQFNLHTGRAWFWVSLFYALLALSHLPTALMVSLLLGLFPLVGPWRSISLWRYYLPLLAGLGLAASMLLPAFFDQHYVLLSQDNSFFFKDFFNPLNRLMLTGLTQLQPQWTQAYEAQLIDFMLMGIGVTVIAAGFYLRYRAAFDVELRIQVRLWLFGLSLALLMMTDLSTFIYQAIPIVQKIQFSWRWMTVMTVMMPLLWAWVFLSSRFIGSLWLRRATQTLLLSLTAVAIALPFIIHLPASSVHPERINTIDALLATRPPFPQEVDMTATPYQALLPVLYALIKKNANGAVFFEGVPEYRPLWVNIKALRATSRNVQLVAWQQGEGSIEHLDWRYGHRKIILNNTEDSLIQLRMFSWPGWQVRVNDQYQAQYKSPTGQLMLPLSAGRHTIAIDYVGTPSEQLGTTLSLMTLILLAGWGLLTRYRRHLRPSAR